ncbi:MAG: hypothetical protein F4Y02_07210 [Chloroflexi bacterium]|nr:hypothetical protein [Chloroflexota bacterium]
MDQERGNHRKVHTPEQDSVAFSSSDLPIALYLNQRLAFDLLAMLEGGFSHFSTVHTASTGETASEKRTKGGIGVSNAFAILGINFGFQSSRAEGATQSSDTTEDLIHTPASLFAKLRKSLHDRNLVRCVSHPSDLAGIHAGDFVEFKGTLRRNFLIDCLDTVSDALPLAKLGSDGSAGSRRAGKQGGKRANNPYSNKEFGELNRNIGLLKSALTAGGSQDLVADLDEFRAVLTTEADYFIDPSINDIIDGTFRIFGKATRVVPDKEESVDLLRKSAAGKLGVIRNALAPLMESLKDIGFDGAPELEIQGPTIQVIPIAIFA